MLISQKALQKKMSSQDLVDFGIYQKLGWTWDQMSVWNPSFLSSAKEGKFFVPATSKLSAVTDAHQLLPQTATFQDVQSVANVIRQYFGSIYFIELPQYWLRSSENEQIIEQAFCDVSRTSSARRR